MRNSIVNVQKWGPILTVLLWGYITTNQFTLQALFDSTLTTWWSIYSCCASWSPYVWALDIDLTSHLRPFDEHLDERIYSLYDPSDPFPLDPFTAVLLVSYCWLVYEVCKAYVIDLQDAHRICPRRQSLSALLHDKIDLFNKAVIGWHSPGSRHLHGIMTSPSSMSPLCTVHVGIATSNKQMEYASYWTSILVPFCFWS